MSQLFSTCFSELWRVAVCPCDRERQSYPWIRSEAYFRNFAYLLLALRGEEAANLVRHCQPHEIVCQPIRMSKIRNETTIRESCDNSNGDGSKV